MKQRVMKARVVITVICITLACAAAPVFTSCTKSSSTPMGTFYFHIQTNIDTSATSGSGFFFDSLGRYIKLVAPQFFISGVILQNVNTTTYAIPNVRILTTLASEQYLIGQAPVGSYSQIMFVVGIDSNSDKEVPGQFTVSGTGAVTSMWYGTTATGYMAMKVNGFYDTTSSPGHIGSGINPIYFSYEIPNNLVANALIRMPVRDTGRYINYPLYTITAGGTQNVYINCDYGRMLSVLNLQTQTNTDGISIRTGIADTLSNSIPGMFEYAQ